MVSLPLEDVPLVSSLGEYKGLAQVTQVDNWDAFWVPQYRQRIDSYKRDKTIDYLLEHSFFLN